MIKGCDHHALQRKYKNFAVGLVHFYLLFLTAGGITAIGLSAGLSELAGDGACFLFFDVVVVSEAEALGASTSVLYLTTALAMAVTISF